MPARHTRTSPRRRRTLAPWLAASLAAGLLAVEARPSTAADAVTAVPTVETTAADEPGDSIDDMAIWVDPVDPSRSVVIGSNHGEHTVEVYDLSGQRLQRLEIGSANNIDIRTGFPLGGSEVALVTVVGSGGMRFFTLDPGTRFLTDVTFGESFHITSSHGVCMYKSVVSGKFYAFRVIRSGIIDQSELFDDGGKVNIQQVRTIDSQARAIEGGNDALEACVVDDENGSLYIAEQDYALWKYGAEPTDPASTADRVLIDTTDPAQGGHLTDDIEGLTVVYQPGGEGFLIASAQGGDYFVVYRQRAPHELVRKVRVVDGPLADGCERTDGIDAVAANLGPAFPRGIFICQDNRNTAPAPGNQNLKYVPLEQVVPLSDAPPPGPGPDPGPDPGPGPGPGPTPGVQAPAPPVSRPQTGPSGYWMLGSGGRVYAFGDAPHLGQADSVLGHAEAVDLEPTPSFTGYWIVDDGGRVFGFGDARHFGNADQARLVRGEQVTSLSASPSGGGYWIFTSRGRALAFGDARHFGDMSAVTLNGPVLDSIPTPSGNGYYMVASDGGIFAFGDAMFYGSMGDQRLNAPVQSLVPDPDRAGYWLVASDGGVFAFEAPFRGSMGAIRLNRPITGMVPFGNGYLMVATDGGVFNFSDRAFSGSLGDNPPARPVVSVAALDE